MNIFLSRNVLLYAVCFFMNTTMYSMKCKVKRTGTLAVLAPEFGAQYNSAKYHEHLAGIGIHSCQTSPLIFMKMKVFVGDCETFGRSQIEKEFNRLQEQKVISNVLSDCSMTGSSSITCHVQMPISMLWSAKTGSTLFCSIDSQPLHLTCVDSVDLSDNQKRSFEFLVKKSIDKFVITPRYPLSCKDELINNGYIVEEETSEGKQLSFGENGFFSLERFVLFHDDTCPEVNRLKTNAHLILSHLQEIQKLYQ